MAHSVRLGMLVTEVAYTVLQNVQRPRVCSAVYGNEYYKEPLKSSNKSRSFCPAIAMIMQKTT